MVEDRELYMRIRERIAARPSDLLTVGQIAKRSQPTLKWKIKVAQIPVGTVQGPLGSLQVISPLDVIKAIRKTNPDFAGIPLRSRRGHHLRRWTQKAIQLVELVCISP